MASFILRTNRLHCDSPLPPQMRWRFKHFAACPHFNWQNMRLCERKRPDELEVSLFLFFFLYVAVTLWREDAVRAQQQQQHQQRGHPCIHMSGLKVTARIQRVICSALQEMNVWSQRALVSLSDVFNAFQRRIWAKGLFISRISGNNPAHCNPCATIQYTARRPVMPFTEDSTPMRAIVHIYD